VFGLLGGVMPIICKACGAVE